MWKKNKFLLILVSLTLTLAILVTGFGWPGYLLGLVPKAEYANDTISKKAKAFSEGNSKAFSIEPVQGMTISAEENALDKDRTFKVKEASDKDYERLIDDFKQKFESPALVYGIWDIDAGLKDDESFPGTYNVTLDLNEFGVPEEDWENCRLYRIDSNGRWTEYGTSVNNGKISLDSRQNSFIFWVTFAALMPLMLDELEQTQSGAYLMPELKMGIRQKDIDSYDIKIDGMDNRFRIILDVASVKQMLFDAGVEMGIARARVADKAARDAINSCIKDDGIREEILKRLPEIKETGNFPIKIRHAMDPLEKAFKSKEEFEKLRKETLTEAVRNLNKYSKQEPEYKKNSTLFKNLAEGEKPTMDELKDASYHINLVADYLEKSYFFLKNQIQVQLPTNVIEVHLSDKTGTDDAGVAINPIFNYAKIINMRSKVVALGTMDLDNVKWEDFNILGNAALVISVEKIATQDRTHLDELLLTMCHELFHICQREYVMSIRANYCFDEMTAQSVEVDAFNYFFANGTIETSQHLSNLKAYQFYAIPLDEYFAVYTEGTLGFEDSWYKPLIGKGAEVSYGRAGFFIYLKDKFKTPYDTILRRYKSLWGKRQLTTILKTVFAEESDALRTQPDRALSHYYYHFITSDEMTEKLLATADGDKGDVFSPAVRLHGEEESVNLLHYDYSTRVRRLYASKLNRDDKQYAIVAKKPAFTNTVADFRLQPANMVKDKDYVELKDGIFINPRDYQSDVSVPSVYMMEIFCGDYTPPRIVHDSALYGYNICLLTPLQEPEMETKSGILNIKEIKRLDYRKDYVDRVVATITLGKDTLLTASSTYFPLGSVKDWKIDLSELKYQGKPLINKQKKDLKITFQECVTGTWDDDNQDKACLGPAATFKVPMDFDITGTYGSQASLSDFSLGDAASQMVGGLAGMIARMFGADPTDEQIQDAVNSGVEFNVQELSYSQTIKIELIKDNKYKVDMDAEVGKFSYEGTLNDDLTLSLNLKNYTPVAKSSDENSIDVTDDFFNKIELQFHKTEDGEAYIDGSYIVKTSMINGTYRCSGTKIPEEGSQDKS